MHCYIEILSEFDMVFIVFIVFLLFFLLVFYLFFTCFSLFHICFSYHFRGILPLCLFNYRIDYCYLKWHADRSSLTWSPLKVVLHFFFYKQSLIFESCFFAWRSLCVLNKASKLILTLLTLDTVLTIITLILTISSHRVLKHISISDITVSNTVMYLDWPSYLHHIDTYQISNIWPSYWPSYRYSLLTQWWNSLFCWHIHFENTSLISWTNMPKYNQFCSKLI